jgi:hypothetical protein
MKELHEITDRCKQKYKAIRRDIFTLKPERFKSLNRYRVVMDVKTTFKKTGT